jgi:hypothetical protein
VFEQRNFNCSMKVFLKTIYYGFFLLCGLWIPMFSKLGSSLSIELISLIEKIIEVGLIILVALNVLDFAKVLSIGFKRVLFFKTKSRMIFISNLDRFLILVFVPLSEYWQTEGINAYFLLLFMFLLTSIRISIDPRRGEVKHRC